MRQFYHPPDASWHVVSKDTLKRVLQLKGVFVCMTSGDWVCREDFARVAQLLGQLDFIPADQFRVQRCLDAVRAQPPAVADRLDAILAAGGRALSSMRELGALRVLADFAGSLPQRVSRATFQQLNRLQSALA